MGQDTAQDSSEAGVNAACGNTPNHRFNYPAPGPMRNGLGHTITAFGIGINSSGGIVGASGNRALDTNPKTITCASSPPTGLIANCNAAGNQATLSWNAVPVTDYYSLRVQNNSVGWAPPASCSVVPENGGSGPGSYCQRVNGTSYTAVVTPGQSYSWWLHARSNSYTPFGPVSAAVSFTCLAPPSTIPPPTPLPTVPPPTPVPPCPISVNKDPVSVNVGGTDTLIVTPDSACGAVTNVTFTSNNTGIATVNPASDSSASYQTVVTGQSIGSTTATVRVNYVNGQVRTRNVSINCGAGPTSTPRPPTPIPTSTPSCSVNLLPAAPASIPIGGTTSFTSTVSVGSGSVSEVRFASSNTGVATVTSPDASLPYTSTATGRGNGTSTITTSVVMGGSVRCTDTSCLPVGSGTCGPTSTPRPPTPIPTTPPGPSVTPVCDPPPVQRPADPPIAFCSPGRVEWHWDSTGAAEYELVIRNQVTDAIVYISNGAAVIGNGFEPRANYGCGAVGTRCQRTTNLPNGVYYSQVRARSAPGPGPCGGGGISPWSNPASAAVACATPPPPQCSLAVYDPPTIDCAAQSITWQWNQVPGADSYQVDIMGPGSPPPYINNDWSPPAAPYFSCSGGTCTYTTSGMPDGAYQSVVTARDTTGTCTQSPPSTSSLVTLACTTTWFGGGGADIVAAQGDLRTYLPPVPIPPYFITDIFGSNLPGIAIGTNIQGNLFPSNVNSQSWLVDSPATWLVTTRPDNQYRTMADRVLGRTDGYQFTTASLNQSQFNSLVDAAKTAGRTITLPEGGEPVAILHRTSGGDLTLSNINLGSRRAIILIEPGAGNLLLTGPSDQQVIGFDPGGLLAVISANNISVDPAVGENSPGTDIANSSYPPHLEGIFFTSGTFNTGGLARQLRVDGSVIGMSGVVLGRTHRGLVPAEFFQFRPDLTYMLSQIGLRTKIYQELIGP